MRMMLAVRIWVEKIGRRSTKVDWMVVLWVSGFGNYLGTTKRFRWWPLLYRKCLLMQRLISPNWCQLFQDQKVLRSDWRVTSLKSFLACAMWVERKGNDSRILELLGEIDAVLYPGPVDVFVYWKYVWIAWSLRGWSSKFSINKLTGQPLYWSH